MPDTTPQYDGSAYDDLELVEPFLQRQASDDDELRLNTSSGTPIPNNASFMLA